MTDDLELDAIRRDAETRRRIREETHRNFIVEAAAGTGKTTCIIDRMVSLVAGGTCAIDQLVAVTFTRKAAAELRERFQAELRRQAILGVEGNALDVGQTTGRLLDASDRSASAFVGTIHSFCATLLRERPIEFGVDPAFGELDELEDQALRGQAWQENISDLLATEDPLIARIDELGLNRPDLRACFDHFIEYRDIERWPHAAPAAFDVDTLRARTREYIAEMQRLVSEFPTERGTDTLMNRYEEIVRAYPRVREQESSLFRMLELFDSTRTVTQKCWHSKDVAKEQRDRWNVFRQDVALPALDYWCRVRYQFVIEFLQRAVAVYARLKAATGGLDFGDLLIATARGLKTQPLLRQYFQARYTHLLVDEFQDTDPVQAELLLYLTSADVGQEDWRRCAPRPGTLFLVGDPKQSIYRFRRGDIVTYNQVKAVFQQSGGEALTLVKNFRTVSQLRTWNNQVFRGQFPKQSSDYAPAAEDMVQGRVDQQAGTLAGLRKLTIDEGLKIEDATKWEAQAVARFIHQAIAARETLPRTARELELGISHEAQPRDFLIIPRGKKRIAEYKHALDRHGIPNQVTGGNAFQQLEQLEVVIACLRAIDDPHNPVHYLAVLRERLFAFNDAELFAFKQAGGRFLFTAALPGELDEELQARFVDVQDRLVRYQNWLRGLPFSSAITRIVEDLGLLATAAAGNEGNVQAGGLLKAIEWLRQQSCNFDSACDLISYLEQLPGIDEAEGCTALSPDANVVRVMNLHKAKGLEAPVVFLVDTSKGYEHEIRCHIDRTGSEPIGYMGISVQKSQWGKPKDVAAPDNWARHQEEERRFLAAERKRLLYVATTRAACQLVISVGRRDSQWSDLHHFLEDAPELEIPSDELLAETAVSTLQAGSSVGAGSSKDSARATVASASIANKWQTARTPTYHVVAAKDLALTGSSRPKWEASGDYGYRWGSAVHELLELSSKQAQEVNLRAAALTAAREYVLGTERVDELLGTVHAVTRSDIWRRAQCSTRRFCELPLETIEPSADGTITLIRGVIDLIFEETDGWVIVDYKTDDIGQSDIPSAIEYYARQLAAYSDIWTKLTRFNVHETGLYFTKLDAYVQVK